jgi:PAS domain S-box-containing protein
MQDAGLPDKSHHPLAHLCVSLGRLESVLEYIAEGIVILDEEGRFCYVNRSAEQILGVPRQEIIGQAYHAMRQIVTTVEGRPLPEAERPLQQAEAKHEVHRNVEIGISRGDGGRALLSVTTVPLITDEGRYIGLVATFLDITARKEAEAALLRANSELDAHVQQRTTELARAITTLDTERGRLRAILDAMPVGVVLVDRNGLLLEMNDRLQDIWFGTAPPVPLNIASIAEYAVFIGWWPQTGRRLQPDEWGPIRALTRGETSMNEVIDIQRFDGTCATILMSSAPTCAGDGSITGALSIIQDITEERALERHARETTATLFAILDQSPLAIAYFDTRLLARQVNTVYAGLVHRDIADIIGQPLRVLLTSELPRQGAVEAAAIVRHCLATGEPYTGSEIPVQLRSDPTVTRYLDWTARRVESPHGDPLGVLVTLVEVTDRVHARQQVEYERARWLTALTTLPSSVIVVDAEGMIEVANPAAEAIWDGPVIGRNLEALLREVQLLDPVSGLPFSREQRPIIRAQGGEVVREVEAVLQRRDGVRIPVFIHAAPIILDGRVVGAIQITQDITRLKEADRIKDEFLATVSHDLRAPLAAIQGWTQMARSSDDLEFIYEALDSVERSVAMQRMLVNDLLDASALAAGTLSLQPEWQDLRPALETVLTSFEPQAISKGLVLRTELSAHPVCAYIDAMRLQQVVGNLLGNAMKFTPTGGAITVRLDTVDSHVRLVVADTGIGIAPDVLPHIFARFYRGDGDHTKSLGLGLAITRALVELHGGQITADSPGPDQGSTFTIILPGAEA